MYQVKVDATAIYRIRSNLDHNTSKMGLDQALTDEVLQRLSELPVQPMVPVPLALTPEQAEQVVKTCRYDPSGFAHHVCLTLAVQCRADRRRRGEEIPEWAAEYDDVIKQEVSEL